MNKNSPQAAFSPIFDRVVAILEEARSTVVRSVNSQMVISYWLIGREIVEAEQKGEARAEYGKRLIETLSNELGERYGSGFSITNLRYFRQFYITYIDRLPEIHHPVGGELVDEQPQGFHPALSWSHYRALIRIDNEAARSFYEIEAVRNHWSRRQLERQINSLLFERLLKSRDKEGLMELADKGLVIEKPTDALKDPYVLEFLDMPESHRLVEGELEEALISHLQEFLLELGSGFAFVGRQKRLTIDGDHFYPDLVFYHVKLKCYVIIDLKVDRLSHADLGQIQMYVHYYDREIRDSGDNPTVGLILCTDKNDAVVRYVLDEDNEQIFASRYKLALPNENELIEELKREMELLEEKE